MHREISTTPSGLETTSTLTFSIKVVLLVLVALHPCNFRKSSALLDPRVVKAKSEQLERSLEIASYSSPS